MNIFLLIIILLFPLPGFSEVESVGIVISNQAELYNDHQMKNMVGRASENQRVLIVSSKFNNSHIQKINLGGYNYWISLQNIIIVDYPQYIEDNHIDPDRKKIIREYLYRLYAH